MINRGGYKVNPYEVEEAIRQHPKVADVVVVGVRGPYGHWLSTKLRRTIFGIWLHRQRGEGKQKR
jgi:acyl-CoA synthetase (AMP-forming)/AMP-acid ligase II